MFNFPSKPSLQVPIVIPIIVLIASVYLVVTPVIDKPALEYLFAVLFIMAGLFLYVPFVYFKLELPFMSKICVPLKTMDTIGNCQRLAFTVGVSQHMHKKTL